MDEVHDRDLAFVKGLHNEKVRIFVLDSGRLMNMCVCWDFIGLVGGCVRVV